MVRAKWKETVVAAALACAGLCGAQNIEPPAPVTVPKERLVTLQESGRPQQTCRMLKAWRQPDGTQAYEVQALDTGERLTLIESDRGDTTAPGSPRLRNTRIFHWGQSRTPPPGVPLSPDAPAESPLNRAGKALKNAEGDSSLLVWHATVAGNSPGPSNAVGGAGGTDPNTAAPRSPYAAAPQPCQAPGDAKGGDNSSSRAVAPAAPSDWRMSWGEANDHKSRLAPPEHVHQAGSLDVKSAEEGACCPPCPQVGQPGGPRAGRLEAQRLEPAALAAAQAPEPLEGQESVEKRPAHAARRFRKLMGKEPMSTEDAASPLAPGASALMPGTQSALAAQVAFPQVQANAFADLRLGHDSRKIVAAGNAFGPAAQATEGTTSASSPYAVKRPELPGDYAGQPYDMGQPSTAVSVYPTQASGLTQPTAVLDGSTSQADSLACLATKEASLPDMQSLARHSPNVAETLQTMLRDALLPSHRQWAAENLAALDWRASPQVVEALLTTARQDPAAMVRAACVRSLAKMQVNTPSVLQTFQSLKADADTRVRDEAEQALTVLGWRQSRTASLQRPSAVDRAPN